MLLENILSQQRFLPDQPVKKDIWLSPNFTAALICLESGLEIKPHPEAYSVFFLILEGRGIITNGEGSIELGPMGSISIGAGEIRGMKSLERLTVLGIHDPH
ncbi:MAG: cupin domain-containing protein [Actinobacteria bacterium]|nr:cupin domain-containing protein [Actinomycetota bacterium]